MLTKSGHTADNGGQRAETWRTKCVETRPKRTQGRDKVDTGRTLGGQGLEARPRDKAVTWQTQDGHKADTRRTSSAGAARAYRGQPFFPKREPTVNCLENRRITVF